MRPNRKFVSERRVEIRTNHRRRRNSDDFRCVLCEKFHGLRRCHKFLRMSVKAREKAVERHRSCVNCLARTHDLRACPSQDTCRNCGEFHHTLLHPTQRAPKKKPKAKNTKKPPQQAITQQPSPPQPAAPVPTASTVPTNIIAEAIRSLANVICSTNNTPSGGQNFGLAACPK